MHTNNLEDLLGETSPFYMKHLTVVLSLCVLSGVKFVVFSSIGPSGEMVTSSCHMYTFANQV